MPSVRGAQPLQEASAFWLMLNWESRGTQKLESIDISFVRWPCSVWFRACLAPCGTDPRRRQPPQLTVVRLYSLIYKRWVCRMRELPSANPVWIKATKHTGIQALCIPIACSSPRLLNTEGDPPWQVCVMGGLLFCQISSIWKFGLYFSSGLECFLCVILECEPQKKQCLLCYCRSRHRSGAVSQLLLFHNQQQIADPVGAPSSACCHQEEERSYCHTAACTCRATHTPLLQNIMFW